MGVRWDRALARIRSLLDVSSERELAATLLAAIAIAGATIGFTTYLLPHPDGTDFVAPTVAFAASLAAGTALWVRRRSAPWWAIGATVALGSVVVTVAMVSVPGRSGAYVTYFVWLGIFAFYFLRPRWALVQTAWIAALYAVAVVLDDQQGPVELWVNGVATTLGVGLLVLALRTRIESLLNTLERTARTDQLTGLPNRRAFDERLFAELARLDRSGDRVALLILDLDRFKQLNDTSGHLAGDEALRVVAGVIRASIRTVDWPARIGGDEFAVLLPGAGEAQATMVAERLRIGIAAAFRDAAVPLAASIGGAARAGDEVDGEELHGEADRALYEAKRRGGSVRFGASPAIIAG
ncbi:MAG TPA: GGDEF domain-containing protein [Solirubrobacterales bacterium]|jgi:diguanylate cyclase (GGDEF)-like protein|nr:GGDEF domain-containing protein [Solirubrobacterales bacterium]